MTSRSVYIIGSHSTSFGKKPETSFKALTRETYLGLLADAGLEHAMAVGLQDHRQILAGGRLVINDQDGRIAAHDSLVLIGRSKEKLLPFPGSLSTQILPACASISLRAIARPSPIPCESEVCCRRKNSLNISWWYSGGIPGPLSETLIRMALD